MKTTIIHEQARQPLSDLMAEVAAEFGLTAEDLKARSRKLPRPAARAEFCRRALALGQYSSTRIGWMIGRDHTSVLYLAGRLRKKPGGSTNFWGCGPQAEQVAQGGAA